MTEAVAAYLSQHEQPSRDPKNIAAWILAHYFVGPTEDLGGGDLHGNNGYEHVNAALDAPRIAADL